MEVFIRELQQTASDLQNQAGRLAKDARQDEADLTKIRANIYEVCATIGQVVCRTQPEEKRQQVYLDKLEALPQNWKAALQAAKTHGDNDRAAVEEIKLEALADVLARFHTRKEG